MLPLSPLEELGIEALAPSNTLSNGKARAESNVCLAAGFSSSAAHPDSIRFDFIFQQYDQ